MNINTERLEAFIFAQGLTNKELAKQVGISAPLLSRIKARGSCAPSTAKRLAKVIGPGIMSPKSDKADPETAERWKQQYEAATAGLMQERADQTREQACEEPDEFEAIILEFIDQLVPEDWSRWPMASRHLFWSGKHNTDALAIRDRVCAAEVWCEAFRSPLQFMRNQDARRINAIIASAPGWRKADKAVRFGPYGMRRGFIRM